MILTDARQQLAQDRFLDAHPDYAEEIRELSAHEQRQQVGWAMEDAAQDQDMEPWEYILELTAENAEELARLREAVHREVAEALGMSWDEYRSLNGM